MLKRFPHTLKVLKITKWRASKIFFDTYHGQPFIFANSNGGNLNLSSATTTAAGVGFGEVALFFSATTTAEGGVSSKLSPKKYLWADFPGHYLQHRNMQIANAAAKEKRARAKPCPFEGQRWKYSHCCGIILVRNF